jgi:hypothetical protein
MKLLITNIILILSFTFSAQAQSFDVILQKSLSFKSKNIDLVLEKTINDIRPFAENFNIRLDSGSKITSAKVVTGTQLQPVLKTTVKKCVFVFCQKINLDAEFTLQEVNGNCNLNYQLSTDLQRSSQMLTDLYSFINADICINKTADGADSAIRVTLVRAPNYSTGVVQEQAFSFIQLQGESILQSFITVIKLNGVDEVLDLH